MSLLRKSKIILTISLIIISSLIIRYTYNYVFASSKEVTEIIPEFKGHAYEFNYQVTDNISEWIGKVVQISGFITEVNNDGIILNESIYCQLDKRSINEEKTNESVIIKGVFVGFDELLMEMKINQCIIL
jgi:hypothetical protein